MIDINNIDQNQLNKWCEENRPKSWVSKELGLSFDTFKKYFPKYKPKILKGIKNILLEQEYEKNPKYCKFCNNVLSYKERINTFCTKTCSATYNNLKRTKKYDIVSKKIYKQKQTEIKVRIHKPKSMYDKVMSKPFNESSWDYKRLRVVYEQNHTCIKCKLNLWLNEQIPLEVDHIDGNTDNNSRENLEALCPNCHAKTSTYRGRNKKRSKFPIGTDFYKKFLELGNIRKTLIFFNLAPKGGNYAAAKHIIYKNNPKYELITETPLSYYTPDSKVSRGDTLVPPAGYDPATFPLKGDYSAS